MVYKPLSDAPHRQFGPVVNKTTPADDEIADLPGGVFFSARRSNMLAGAPLGLYYKDGTGNVRRVRFGAEPTPIDEGVKATVEWARTTFGPTAA